MKQKKKKKQSHGTANKQIKRSYFLLFILLYNINFNQH